MAYRYEQLVLKHFDVRNRSGEEWQCLCVFHNDSSPSLSINVSSGLYICYACGAKGNGKTLARHLGELAPSDSQCDIDALEEKIRQCQEVKKVVQHRRVDGVYWESRYRLVPNWSDEWVKRLGNSYSDELADRFSLGYDVLRDELVIPIFDWNGSAEGAVRRRLGNFDGPKYLYSKGFKTSQHLYGAWQARVHHPVRRPKRVAIVEGTIDALSLWGVGITAVALLGSQLSPVQKRLLYKIDALEYVVMTDRDQAGAKAAMQVEQAIRGTGSLVVHPTVWAPGRKDVAEMTAEERIEAFDSARHATVDLH